LSGDVVISPVRSDGDVAAAVALFRAYADSLDVDLSYQDFAGELAAMPGRYAPPAGALLLARDGAGAALGCVGLRPMDEAAVAHDIRLDVHARPRLPTDTAAPIAALPEVMELNIGHCLIGEAIFSGLDSAVRRMRATMDEARRDAYGTEVA
jgi:pyridoxine 5'-phosphate synthase PdxJ